MYVYVIIFSRCVLDPACAHTFMLSSEGSSGSEIIYWLVATSSSICPYIS